MTINEFCAECMGSFVSNGTETIVVTCKYAETCPDRLAFLSSCTDEDMPYNDLTGTESY